MTGTAASALGLCLSIAALLSGCTKVVLVTPYDEVTDTRLQDYRDALNVLVKRAAAATGTQAGTFEAAKDGYLDLEVRISGLVDRAKTLDRGLGCKLNASAWTRIKSQLSQAAGLPASNPATGDESGCITMMLTNVQANLSSLESVHKDPAQCQSTNSEAATCLRGPAAAALLAVSNQTIDAVLFVQHALKRHEEVN